MKKYRVNVNGTNYEIELEVLGEGAAAAKPAAAPSQPAPAPKAAPSAAPAPVAAPAGGEKIESPMPGTIVSINVAVGDKIKKGQVLMILEAMKMENEIMSPVDGTVASVNVTSGTNVSAGELLCSIN